MNANQADITAKWGNAITTTTTTNLTLASHRSAAK